jgi:DNA-binding beta-propeller fold protein YncE
VCNPIYPLCYEGNTAYQGTVGFYPINRDGTLNAPKIEQAGLYPGALAVHHAGKFLVVVNATSSTVMVFDAITGQLHDTKHTGTSPQAVAFDPLGRPEGPVVYVGSRASSTISTFTIENGTGRLTLRGVVNALTHPNSMATTPRLSQ